MPETQKIICPNCKTEISVDDVLHAQIETRIRAQYEAEKRKDNDAILAKEVSLGKRAEELELAKKSIDKTVLDAIGTQKAELAKKEEEFEKAKRDMDTLVNAAVKEQIAVREKEIQKQAKIDAENEKKQEIEALKSHEEELTSKLTEARNEQIKLMDDKKKLQDDKEAFEIEKRKQLEDARAQIKEENDKKIFELSKKTEELNAAKENFDKTVSEAISTQKAELAKKEKEIEKAKRDMDTLVNVSVKEQIAAREKEIQKQAKIDAENEKKQEIESLKSHEEELTSKLTAARSEQIKLMDEKKKLEEDKEAFEIEKRKQLEEASAKIKEEANRKAAENYQTILAQKEKTLSDALKVNEDLKRKIEQGSQQSQGEVAELNLETELSRVFIYDSIEPVSKGVRGADVIQKVRNSTGKDCGQIIWEVKNTKAWSDSWIKKLKDDQREVHADIAIIISNAMPDGIKTFAFKEGVWICDIALAIPIATILHDKLEAIAREKGLAIGKNEKMDVLYQYLTGVQFRQRIEAIVETFTSMKEEIDKEKRYFTKKWATQEKQIEKIIKNTIGAYGDINGIVSLPKIQLLELEYDDTEHHTETDVKKNK